MTTHDVFAERPRPVESRFELAALRLTDACLRARRFAVSPEDVAAARDFLGRDGTMIEDVPGRLLRLHPPQGPAVELTCEDAVLLALRRLATAAGRRRADAQRTADDLLLLLDD